VIIPLDGENDLFTQGFEYLGGGGTSTFQGGMLTIDGPEEWMLYSPTPSKWWDEVLPEKGWWIEVRLRIDDADPDCLTGNGPGLWIHDRGKFILILFTLDHVAGATTGARAPFDTSEFHVYRVEDYGDGTRRLLVDGVQLLDLSGDIVVFGTEALGFGDLGGCLHSHVVWDYFAYDTFAPGAEDGDVDGDGVPNAEDDCFEIPDPEQLDTDGDGRGDVCDPCPLAPRAMATAMASATTMTAHPTTRTAPASPVRALSRSRGASTTARTRSTAARSTARPRPNRRPRSTIPALP